MKPVRIFLSSPGDVGEERTLVRDLLLNLDRTPLLKDRVRIDVVSWDDPHAPAPMDAHLSPQEAVNRGLPKPSECDLVVVLLWGRMGTPLTEKKADGTFYQSGTGWEFEDALRGTSATFLYRRSEKVFIDSDDPDADEKLTQRRKVDAFFKQFRSEGGAITRSFSTYGKPHELVDRVRSDVHEFLARLLVTPSQQNGVSSAGARAKRTAAAPEVPVAYRDWVKRQHGGVDLLGLRLKKGRPPTLSSIYVPQVTLASSGEARRRKRSSPSKLGKGTWRVEMPRGQLLLDRLTRESLSIRNQSESCPSVHLPMGVWT
jgi:hypothetical protein